MYNNTRAIDIVYLDFQKSFYKVPHNRLISKVKAHGITGNLHNWIKNWLTDRKQQVVLNGKASDWIRVNSGVPQGSVLGPILFIIYVNDIDDGIACKISKFANIVITEAQRQIIQKDLNTLVDWSEKWHMKFNLNKYHVLHIGNYNPLTSYSMKDVQLKSVDKEKDLSVIITSDL